MIVAEAVSVEGLLGVVESNVSLIVIVVLLAIGYAIKHTPVLDKISNNFIPIILMVLGVIFALLTGDGKAINLIITGILSGVIATGIHSSGKNIFSYFSKASSTITEALEDTLAETDSEEEKADE